MKVQVYKVKNPDSCISEIVDVKSDTSTDTLTHFVPPFGCPEIIFYIGQTHQIKNVPFAKGAIKGLYNVSQKIDFIPNYHFLIIRLQPFGLKQLFNINASELLNSVMDIENHPITEVVFNFFDSRETLDYSFLKTLVNYIEQYAIFPISISTKEFIKLVPETAYKTIKDLTFQNGIGLRTLQRNFKKEVGLSPKEYLRIKRLNAIEQKMSQNADVFEIIAGFDYSDQAHFIKDFKKLRSFTPTEILKKKLLLSDQLTVPEIISI
jgi:AraC-like DNA-binding protein